MTAGKALRDVALTVAVSVAFLLLIEGALRFAGVNYDGSFYRPDREFGYVLRPGAHGWNVKEHETYVTISSQGLRDREHTWQRPAGVIRIAVVGDSFSEAKEVDQDAAYWAVLERELNRSMPAGGPRIEVINFGVDGYGLAQEYLVLKEKIWAYDPQIVILSGTLHSLILHSSRYYGSVSSEGPVPFFVHGTGGLQLDATTLRQRAAFVPPTRSSELIADISNSSRVLSLVNTVRRQAATGWSDFRKRLRGGTVATTREVVDTEKSSLRGPADANLAEAWSISEDLIRLAHADVAEHQAEFWFVLLDMAPQVDPDPVRRAATLRTLGIDDLFLADKDFARFAEREGINHQMLAPKMLAYAEAHHAVLHGFIHRPRNTGHWNETGHRAAGELIAQRLFDCSPTVRGAPTAPGAACFDDFKP